jgi:hypothetical protein
MSKATYGDLEQTLLTLGFSVTTGVGEYGAHYTRYDNAPCDAWIILASAPKDEPVRPGDLYVVERTLVGKGVADSKRFHKLLGKHEERVPVGA